MNTELSKKMSHQKHVINWIGCSLIFIGLISFMIFDHYNRDSFVNDYQEIIKRGELRVVIEQNPISYQEISLDSIVGLQVAMIEEFAAVYSLQVKYFRQPDLDKAMDMLLNEEVDILAWHIPVYSKLKEKISYTIPVFTSRQMLIQRKLSKDSNTQFINNQLDLSGKTIYILPAAAYRQRLSHLEKEIGDTIYIHEIPNATPVDLFKMVRDSAIDYTVCDEFVAKALQKDFPEIDMQTAISFTQNYSWGLNPKSTSLKDSIDNWLSGFLQSDDYKKLVQSYK